jgi:hypothetical protein
VQIRILPVAYPVDPIDLPTEVIEIAVASVAVEEDEQLLPLGFGCGDLGEGGWGERGKGEQNQGEEESS